MYQWRQSHSTTDIQTTTGFSCAIVVALVTTTSHRIGPFVSFFHCRQPTQNTFVAFGRICDNLVPDINGTQSEMNNAKVVRNFTYGFIPKPHLYCFLQTSPFSGKIQTNFTLNDKVMQIFLTPEGSRRSILAFFVLSSHCFPDLSDSILKCECE